MLNPATPKSRRHFNPSSGHRLFPGIYLQNLAVPQVYNGAGIFRHARVVGNDDDGTPFPIQFS